MFRRPFRYVTFHYAICIMLLAHVPLEALARIKLITLPVRERVEIQLDHPSVTLVEEERIVPLVQGVNQVDFSWANTRIDPDTLVFRVLAPADENAFDVQILAVSYPPNENALIWSVFASASGAARVRISYLLGGLSNDFHYRAIADNDETTLTLSQLMRVNNNANESYEQAYFWAGFGESFDKPLGIDETKEILAGKFRGIPITKTYTADPVGFGYLDRSQDKLNVPMHYVIKNSVEGGLGQAALPFGKVRIYQNDGKGGSAFIGEDWGKFTPVDDEMKLYLGLAQDIVVKRTIARNESKRIKGNLYDYEVSVKYEIENFKDQPVTLTIIEDMRRLRDEIRGYSTLEPQWEVLTSTTLIGPEREDSDAERLVFTAELPPRASTGAADQQIQQLDLVFRNEW